jgi:hypothetical protein
VQVGTVQLGTLESAAGSQPTVIDTLNDPIDYQLTTADPRCPLTPHLV